VTDDLDTVLAEAEQALSEDEESYALELLGPFIAQLDDSLSDGDWSRVYALARAAWLKDQKPELASLLDDLLADPKSPRAAYRLGYLLVEKKLPSMASGVLGRALRHHPDDLELRHELVASLELQGRYSEAAAFVEPAATQAGAPFLTRYLFAFNLLASGRGEAAESIARDLDPAGDAPSQFMRARLDGMLRRKRFTGQEWTPRAVHFVLSGALLLEEQVLEYREESWATLGADLVRLRAVLEAVDRKPPRVVSLYQARHKVLGTAAASLLGLPFEQQHAPEGEGLFVSHDLAAIFPDLAEKLRAHRPEQVYYAHYASARRELLVCSDAIGVRGDRVVSPWDLFTIIDSSRTDLPKGPPTESEDELARKIVDGAAAPSTLSDLPSLIDFARRAAAADLLALGQKDGEREKLWPYPSGPWPQPVY
jgi:hypothetical protein